MAPPTSQLLDVWYSTYMLSMRQPISYSRCSVYLFVKPRDINAGGHVCSVSVSFVTYSKC